MKKKVFFIMSTNDFSGAENVNFSIINGLKDTYDFYWVSRKGKINSFLEEQKINWIEIEKLSIKEIRRIVKENNPDVLHATDFTASCICAMSMVKTKIISHLHHNAPWLKKINIKTILYLLCSIKFEKILIVSNSIEKEYIFSKLIRGKIKCIGNPISTKKITDLVQQNDNKEKYDICCVGRLTEAKDPIRFLEIVLEIKKTHENIKVLWVGSGELSTVFQKKIKEMNLCKNVEYIGFQKNPYTYMANSKIFMLASKWEGFGLVAFEALTLGLPCVASNVGGIKSIVNNECGMLCITNNDFCNAVNKLLSDKNIYNKYKQNALKRAKELENINEYLTEIKKIYNNL